MSDHQPILRTSRSHHDEEEGASTKRRHYGAIDAKGLSSHHHRSTKGSEQLDGEPASCWSAISKWLQVNRHVSEEDKERRRSGDCGWFYCYWRDNLGEFLEHKYTQYVLVSLLVLDVILLAVDLGLEGVFHGTEDHTILFIEHSLQYISIGILSVFAIEVFFLMIAFDFTFFLHPLYVMDAIIVGVAFVIELILKDVLVAGFLIVLRLWRVVRIIHGIIMMAENSHAKTKEELAHLQAEFDEQTAEMDTLQNDLSAARDEARKWKELYDAERAGTNTRQPQGDEGKFL